MRARPHVPRSGVRLSALALCLPFAATLCHAGLDAATRGALPSGKGERFRDLHHTALSPEASPGQGTAEDPSSGLGPWPSFRQGFQGRGRAPVALRPLLDQPPGGEPRSLVTRGIVWGTPVTDVAGNVYVGSADKRFYSVGAGGELRWSYTLPDAGDALVDSAATLAPGNLVVVPGGDGRLHALDRDTGALRWQFKAYHAGDHDSGVVVNSFEGNVVLGPDGNLYAGSDNGHFYSVDLQGQERWNVKTGMMIWSAAAFSPSGEWFAFGSLDGKVYVVRTTDGSVLATYKAGGDIKSSPAIDDQGRIYVGCSDFSFRSLELGKDWWGKPALKERWAFPTRGEIYSSPAMGDGRVYFGSHDGYLYCLTLEGELVWKYGTHARINASPLLSSDGVLLVGAKNGKLYALDAESGERIWSFKAAPGARKVNLDSSPSLAPDGTVHVGSYDGNVYAVPVGWPRAHAGDPRVDLRPGDDVPDFGGPVPSDGATLRVLDQDGRLVQNPAAPVGIESALVLRLVTHEEGVFAPNAALAVTGLDVKVEPAVPFEAVVASDGYSLNLFPKGFWKPGVRHKVTVSGRWYRRSNPFVDLLKWWSLPPVAASFEFETRAPGASLPTAPEGSLVRYAVRDLYAAQPEILDTLIPAAMDGQAFVASLAFSDPEKGRIGIMVLPAFPRPDGVVVRPAPEKVFAVDGWAQGDAIRTYGEFDMAAMGATIPFRPFRMAGRLTGEGILDGAFHATAPVYRIKGNGSTYTGLSWSAIDDMADAKLRLQALGTLGGVRLPRLETGATVTGSRWLDGKRLEVTLELTGATNEDSLLTVAFWDPVAGKVAGHASALPGNGSGTRTVVLGGLSRSRLSMLPSVVMIDGEKVSGPAGN